MSSPEQPTFLPRGDVGPEVDVPEGAAPNLATKPVLVSDPELHSPCELEIVQLNYIYRERR